MIIEGIVTQKGEVVKDITGVSLVWFKHTKLDRSARYGWAIKAKPGGETLGEFEEEQDAISVMEKIADKVKRFRESAFIVIPEDHTALMREREAFYARNY